MAVNLSSGSAKRSTVSPSINVTPLVDIVLVVLIIFMLVTPMMTKTFWLNLPPRDEPAEKPPTPAAADVKPVVMTVDSQGTIRVNQVVMDKRELPERLPRVLSGAGQRVLYFDAADGAAYSAAVEALDLSRSGGVRSIAILTEKVAK